MSPAFLWLLALGPLTVADESALKKSVEVLASSTEKVWETELAREGGLGLRHKAPRIVLFRGGVVTGCGEVPARVGPFYCPADSTVYLDRSFFADIDRRLRGDKAEFARAYLFAWLSAKQVLNQAGLLKRLADARGKPGEKEAGIRVELCASYLAGVWAHHAAREHKYLEPKDAEEVIKTVRAMGDDRIQNLRNKSVQQHWRWGTARQYVHFFSEGMKTGDASKARLERFFSDKYDPKTGELREK